MVKIEKCLKVICLFAINLTFLLTLYSCSAPYSVTKIEGKQIKLENQTAVNQEIETLVAPFRTKINKDLDQILAFCPETLDKSKGEWQSNIGDLVADVTLKKCNPVFLKRTGNSIDFCLLNHGGIRAIMPQGNVSTRTAFEIMPFENSAVVVALNGEKVLEMLQFFIKEKKPHPLSGISFNIGANHEAKNIKIDGKEFNQNQTYFVVTNDYLANGGDNMNFFVKGKKTDLEYKMRNILIDYLKEVDEVVVSKTVKVTREY